MIPTNYPHLIFFEHLKMLIFHIVLPLQKDLICAACRGLKETPDLSTYKYVNYNKNKFTQYTYINSSTKIQWNNTQYYHTYKSMHHIQLWNFDYYRAQVIIYINLLLWFYVRLFVVRLFGHSKVIFLCSIWPEEVIYLLYIYL